MNEQDFQAAILNDLDNDVPRLVYADWLDEHGDEHGRAHAALIRLQCELERLPAEDRRRRGLERQVGRVLKSRDWTRALRDADLGGEDWTFRRGFVNGVTISARRFVEVAEQLFQLAPTLQSCRFPDASNEVTGLARCPYLARLREVDLTRMCVCGMCHIDRELWQLSLSPHAANLTSLRLSQDRVDSGVAGHLAAAPHFGRLLTLDLSRNNVAADGVRALMSATRLDRLTTLILSHNNLRTAGIRALAEGCQLKSLTSLALGGNKIGPVGARLLAAMPHLAQLTELHLAGNQVGDVGARALAASPYLDRLSLLDLSGNGIGADVAAALRSRFGKRVHFDK